MLVLPQFPAQERLQAGGDQPGEGVLDLLLPAVPGGHQQPGGGRPVPGHLTQRRQARQEGEESAHRLPKGTEQPLTNQNQSIILVM